MASYTKLSYYKCEDLIQKALNALRNKEFSTIIAAARVHGVPASTLGHCLQGQCQNRVIAHANEQLLTSKEEEVLVSWVQYQN